MRERESEKGDPTETHARIVQGAGLELGHLAILQSKGFCAEIKTFCVLFFVNERQSKSLAALRCNLNLARFGILISNRVVNVHGDGATDLARVCSLW